MQMRQKVGGREAWTHGCRLPFANKTASSRFNAKNAKDAKSAKNSQQPQKRGLCQECEDTWMSLFFCHPFTRLARDGSPHLRWTSKGYTIWPACRIAGWTPALLVRHLAALVAVGFLLDRLGRWGEASLPSRANGMQKEHGIPCIALPCHNPLFWAVGCSLRTLRPLRGTGCWLFRCFRAAKVPRHLRVHALLPQPSLFPAVLCVPLRQLLRVPLR